MVNVLSRAWTSAIRNLLRPKELLYSVISCVRFAARPLAGMLYVGSDDKPAAFGVQADCVGVDVSAISRTNNNPTYPWSLAGIPAGVVRFGKSLSGECALLGTDFIYENGEYRFRTTPIVFASLSGGYSATPRATFSITYGNRARITYQDLFNNYNGAVDSVTIDAIKWHDECLACSNGFSGYVILAACGVKAAKMAAKIKAVWQEGSKFLAATERNELIVDIAKNPKIYPGAMISPESSITDAINTNIAIACIADDTGRTYKHYWLPANTEVSTANMPNKFRAGSTLDSVRLKALSAYPIKTYDTTLGPSDSGSNVALAKRMTTSSSVKLVQRLSIDLGSTANRTNATKVILHIGALPQEPNTKLMTGECTLNYASYMYNCLVISDAFVADGVLYALSLNTEKYTPEFIPGNYILGVGLASSYDESILEYKSIEPVVIKAGACVALDIH